MINTISLVSIRHHSDLIFKFPHISFATFTRPPHGKGLPEHPRVDLTSLPACVTSSPFWP